MASQTIKMEIPIHGVLMLGERDAYVASDGSRALGVAICDTVLWNVAIGLLDVWVRESSRQGVKWPQIQRMQQGDTIRIRYVEVMKEGDEGTYDALMSSMKDSL